MATPRCVVCEQSISEGQERYADDWERVRGRFPCCSGACCEAFDPDEHWIPAVEPQPASREEEQRLLQVTVRRLGDGDRPTVVLHEMLQAGVSPAALRPILDAALHASRSSRRAVTLLNVVGAIKALLTGQGTFYSRGDKPAGDDYQEALVSLERWKNHWPRSS